MLNGMFRVLVLLTISSFIGGCVSTSGKILPTPEVTKFSGQWETIYEPKLEVVIDAEVGQTLISKTFANIFPAIRVSQSRISHDTHNNSDFNLSFNGGVMKKWGSGSEGTYYVTSAPGTRTGSAAGLNYTRAESNSGLIVASNFPNSAQAVFWNPAGQLHTFVSKLEKPILVEQIKDVVEVHLDNYKRELIYTGISKNVISVLYREYIGDLIRPAYTQELKYDLSESNVIGFKGARFQVISATNVGIKYKVLKHLF